ncbi:leucine-rich repeat-containing protein 4B-like isoform X2 [Lineus longissimus]
MSPPSPSMVMKILPLSLLLLFGLGVSYSSAIPNIESPGDELMLFLFNDTSCPTECVCNNTLQSIYCKEGYRVHFASFVEDISKVVQNLTVVGAWFPNIPGYLNKLHSLQHLAFPECRIETINETAFTNMTNLVELNLSGNLLHSLDERVFSNLSSLQVLDLSHNLIDRLPEKVFKLLISLKVLNIRSNRIQYFASKTFHNLRNLNYLDISFNQLHFLESKSLQKCSKLQYLLLGSNSLRSLHEDTLFNLTKLRDIELDNNPWVCSCSLQWLATELNSTSSDRIYKNPHDIKCQSPLRLKAQQVRMITLANMECTEPDILSATESQAVIYQDHMVLRCNVSGYPRPSVYWITPLGEYVAHESQREWINLETDALVTFNGMPTFNEARATPLEDGSLYLSNFRRYFAGSFQCIAVNPVGNTNFSITVNITSRMPQIQVMCFIVGFSSMGLGIIMGLIGGCIRLLVDYLSREDEKESEVTEVEEEEKFSSMESISPAHSPKRWPRHSPGGSPTKPYPYYTDDEYDSDEGHGKDTFTNDLKDMKETLDEMHVRLRRGMQHTTEKMRTRMKVQTVQLKESTSHYMHTIRDSSAHTAHRMRAGMAMSLEQMKSGVQSIKEFCGTGDMSHTVSTVSVSTDVDSQEMTTVVKNITYV